MTKGNQETEKLLPSTQTTSKERNGTWFYAGFHSATAMIGAGVLSMPWALSYLGWIMGISMLMLGFIASFFSADLLATLHESQGKRFDQYSDLGRYVLGRQFAWVIPLFQLSTAIGTGITYIITGAESARQAYTLIGGSPDTDLIWWIIGFGIMQILLVQLPDYHSLRFISMLGTLMAVGYCFIALIASIHHSVKDGPATVNEQRGDTLLQQVFGCANAIGSILFAFGGLSTILEVQSTLPSPSRPVMMKGITFAYGLGLFLYTSVAVSGYLAFGNMVKDNVLVSTGKPDWLVACANIMVLLHVMAGYQVYSMVVFMLAESRMDSSFSFFRQNWLTRLIFRTIFVILGAMVAAYLPFFGAVNGFVGAAGIAMITFILPQLLSLIHFRSSYNLGRQILQYGFVVVIGLLSLFSIAGTLFNIVQEKTK